MNKLQAESHGRSGGVHSLGEENVNTIEVFVQYSEHTLLDTIGLLLRTTPIELIHRFWSSGRSISLYAT